MGPTPTRAKCPKVALIRPSTDIYCAPTKLPGIFLFPCAVVVQSHARPETGLTGRLSPKRTGVRSEERPANALAAG